MSIFGKNLRNGKHNKRIGCQAPGRKHGMVQTQVTRRSPGVANQTTSGAGPGVTAIWECFRRRKLAVIFAVGAYSPGIENHLWIV